jgi:poly-beta-1,6-N-acetyl-D-glucosamine synthase
VVHHRTMGAANHSTWGTAFKGGFHDYLMGVHPLWQCCRACYQMTRKPWIVGGGLLLAGYVWAALKRAKRPVSQELVDFRRGEQMRRLKGFLLQVLRFQGITPRRGVPAC